MTAEDAINVFKEQFCGLEAYCEIHRDGLCLTDGCEVWWAIKALEQCDEMRLSKEDFGTLCICAIRYCHGRQTYMPDLIRGIISSHLKEIDDRNLDIMIDDCGFQERMHLYGDERIDKPGWLQWKDMLLEEKKRRCSM